jgi:chromosome segregation ATPase
MLVALGFLAATLLGLLVAPAFWARAVRLTTSRIKDSMPLTDVEIRADKDRLRAEYAIRVHKLESQVDHVKFAAARQQIELNRRDARINEVEGELERLRASFEEAQNARRVLEQTVSDRLPRVEDRLGEAKRLLHTRDQEIAALAKTAERQTKALEEAAAINAQQQNEVERLRTSLATRAARNQDALADPRFDGEIALRAEIEALRAKTREQAQMLSRLQSMTGRSAGAPSQPAEDGNGGSEGARQSAAAYAAQLADSERQLRAVKARNEDQSGEIARLRAAIAVFEGDPDGGKASPRESRIGMKARVQSLEAQNALLSDTVQKLRSELASANERSARQAAHFTNELKRLGAGTLPAAAQVRRTTPEPARLSLAERMAQARSTASAAEEATETPAERETSSEARHAAVYAVSEAGASDPSATPPSAAGDGPEAGRSPAQAPAARPQPRPRLLDRIAGIARSS